MKAKKEDTTKSDETMEDLQAELIRLQRQFRLLEDDRRAYREETEYVLRKQRDSISNLNDEHEDLSKDYKLACSVKNQKFDKGHVTSLKELLEEEEHVKAEHRAQMESNAEVNRKTKNIKKEMERFRKKMGGCTAAERRYKAMIKHNRDMENRLNEAIVKFNTALGENTELREEINTINTQRKRFTELQQKLSKMLMNGKVEKEYLIEQSTLLFNSRDEAEHRMHSLRERSERDMNLFNSELKDLLRVIDHDKKLREFMRTKMEERSEIYEAAVNGRKEKKLLDYVKALQIEVEHYETIFNGLVEVSNTDDIDQMVDEFIHIEDQNFAQFNFVKEKSQEIQMKESSIHTLKQNIEKMEKEDVFLESKHKAIQNTLEDKEQRLKVRKTQVNAQIKLEQKSLASLCTKIDSMLTRINCDRSAMTELLAGSKITDDTLVAYLGLIEQRATEMLQARSLILLRKGEEGLKEDIGDAEQAPITFFTVGRIARYLLRMPSLTDEIPDVFETSSQQGENRPISQREARLLAINNGIDLARLQSRQSNTRTDKK